jgi:hypothetical protein
MIHCFPLDEIHVQRRNLSKVPKIFFPFTCASKYQRLGLNWNLENEGLIPEETMEELASAVRKEGLDFVHRSGLTAK